MGFIGVQELVLILVIVIVLFGAKKIPELARGLGTGLKEFKKATSETDQQLTAEEKKTETTEKKS
ncbi:MAG TPA: twin-arginine translocase TatA/TatE family subunit [Chitinispirillaceae bacterium]|nr:twin-arginine translocase TatA/TatE family subunit [Chitinispirillaceae bacterium]